MGVLKIRWYRRALHENDAFMEFYVRRVGVKAARHYLQDVQSTINTLAQMPTMGRLEEDLSNENARIYSFVFHKRGKLFYRFTSRTLYIVAIKCILME